MDGSPIFYRAEDELQEELAREIQRNRTVEVCLFGNNGKIGNDVNLIFRGGISNYLGYRNFSLSFKLTYSLG